MGMERLGWRWVGEPGNQKLDAGGMRSPTSRSYETASSKHTFVVHQLGEARITTFLEMSDGSGRTAQQPELAESAVHWMAMERMALNPDSSSFGTDARS